MKVRFKIAISVIPALLILIVALNFSFGLFFESYVKKEENTGIQTLTLSVDSYFKNEKDSLLGNVNDWAHWDDASDYVATSTHSFIEKNMMADSFKNLHLNFLLIEDTVHHPLYQQYYSTEFGFSGFPEGFSDSYSTVADEITGNEDSCGIYKIGNSYYIVASSDITDSLQSVAPSGKLIMGRQLDEDSRQTIEQITGCIIEGFSDASALDTAALEEDAGAQLIGSDIDNARDTITLTFVLPNAAALEHSVSLKMTMPRTIYLSALKNMAVFAIGNTAVFVVFSLVILYLISRFLTAPFKRLVDDIRQLDLTTRSNTRLNEKGSDEFSFIRKSLNQLLAKLDSYHDQLTESQEMLHATLLSVGDGVISVDTAGAVTFLNHVAEQLTGWTLAEATGKPIETVLHIVNEFSRAPIPSPIYSVFEKDAIVELDNHTLLLAKDGVERPIEDTAAPIKDRNGATRGCVIVFRDFSERKEKQRRIEYLSFHDQLTGLYNRRYFEEALKKMQVMEPPPLSFIYADLNGLKIINDAFGHESGDEIIRWVAELFRSECRSTDIVARIGGDEFVVLLPHTGKDEVEALVGRLKAKADTKRYQDIELSISFGWDTKEDLRQPAAEILKNAEDTMYQKKILNNSSKRSGIITSILNTLHVKCPREEAHSKRVSSLCESIGNAYGLGSDDIKELVLAGELHDIGKIAVDEIILNNTSPLSEEEWSQIKRHPETGYRLLGATSEFSKIAEFVLSHHERWDGLGYPRGLKGADINWKARVIAVADSYDAMTSDRPYRKALSSEIAAKELRAGAGSQFDPDITRVFVEEILGLPWHT